ncbi:hypothetical protein ACI3ET_04600 [Ornithinimicrobium sp. LYQ121]|uniref:hypothetical protein n=1 Tax=Ornithinimicrobium sp. LYQ121 TaxID=3378801 RepID=UPI00385465F9
MRIGAVLLTMTVGLGVSACIAPSGFETVGRTGVTSVDGELAIVWDSCGEDEVRSVELHQDREGLADDEENPRVGEWELGDRDREQKLLVLAATDDPPQLDPARGYVAQAVPAGTSRTSRGSTSPLPGWRRWVRTRCSSARSTAVSSGRGTTSPTAEPAAGGPAASTKPPGPEAPGASMCIARARGGS